MKKRIVQLCVTLYFLGLTIPAIAHPHVFIVPKVHFSFGGEQLNSIHVEWIFDEMTTLAAFGAGAMGETYRLESSQHNTVWGQSIPMPSILGDLCSIELDGVAVTLAQPIEIQMAVVKGQLIYSFSFRLDQPIKNTGKAWFFDQSNFIAFDTLSGTYDITQTAGATPVFQVQKEKYVDKIVLGF